MKSKLQISTAIFLFSLSMALAQAGPPTAVAGPAIDPTTGLPIPAPSQPGWKDPEWKDPDIVLKKFDSPGLSITEVAGNILEQFKGQFDIILPAGNSSGGINHLTGNPVGPNDWQSEGIKFMLQDVTASEIFNAMNLIFENDKTPLRWELKVNGHRQLALLRVLVDPAPETPLQPPPPPPEPQRRIYFVGDLIGDEKDGGMTMEQIIKTITDVWQMTDTANGKIQFHNDAQLLVVTGTTGQIQFVEQTLNALHQKISLARRSLLKASETKTKTDELKK